MVKIALDAGHGLKTSGKQTPDGIKEWTLNDKVRDKVVEFLKGYDVSIIHTDNNEGNVDESLASRLSRYKASGVDVFASIHHNATTGRWNNATGVEIYTDNNPTNDDLRLARCIYERLVANTGLKGRGIKKLNFYVINQNTIPAVLIEGGFMDSVIDYPVITSDAGQTAYAKAVAEGLIEFLGLEPKKTEIKPTQETKVIYRVQTGSFRSKNYAIMLYDKVKRAGYSPYMIKADGLYKIQLGAFSKKANADALAQKLERAGFDTYISLKGGEAVAITSLKSIDEIAREVINGKRGVGNERIVALKEAGYDPDTVQKRVNELL